MRFAFTHKLSTYMAAGSAFLSHLDQKALDQNGNILRSLAQRWQFQTYGFQTHD